MSDEYDLQTLLEIRERERDGAEAAYATEMQELDRLKKNVEELQEQRDDLIASRERRKTQFDQKMAEGADLAAMQQFDEYLSGVEIDLEELAEKIDHARQLVARQQRVVDEKKEALIEAEKSLKAVEKHRESWEEEQSVIARRKESNRLDEIASRRWQEQNK